MTLLAEDRERLDRKLKRQRTHAKTSDGLSRRDRLAFVRQVSEDLGRPPSRQELADADGPLSLGKSYLLDGGLDATLRAAFVPTTADVVVDWIREHIVEEPKGTFFARDVAADTGFTSKRAGKALERLRDGEAIVSQVTRFDVVVVARTQKAIRWGIDQ